MSRLRVIVRREVLELIRQPAMIATISALFVIVGALVALLVGLLQLLHADDDASAHLAQWTAALGLGDAGPEGIALLAVTTGSFLLFTQYLGISGVLAGHTTLHDRQCGTLPFLLLAPVSRTELLLGKVVGALVPPTALYLGAQLTVMGFAALLPVSRLAAGLLPPSGGWWVATFVGAPLWAGAVAILCAIVSAVARDVRTAQQGVWLLMFFATLGAGYLLAARMADGALTQFLVALLGASIGGAALFVGARVLSRDLGR